MKRDFISSIEKEYRRYKKVGDGAIDQLDDAEVCLSTQEQANSVATIVFHLSGNLKSRFTDFLTSDGEKPWRNRDSEFVRREASKAEVVVHWKDGWELLFQTLSELSDGDLERIVSIRSVAFPVHEALHRSLAHTSYHVGQIVYAAKAIRGSTWKSLSIPLGGSSTYNESLGHR